MFAKRLFIVVMLIGAVAFLLTTSQKIAAAEPNLTAKEQLGKFIFFDEKLSLNGNQSCATCHAPESGWTGPDSATNQGGAVYEGSISAAFGDRKPPSSAYTTQSPVLHFVIEKKEALFIGGNFWDGRATGERLGNPAVEQAQGPFLNTKEQALPDAASVVTKVCSSVYSGQFKQVWAELSKPPCTGDTVEDYDRIAFSIAAYEASSEVNAFTSKYDYYLKGEVELTKLEKVGLNMFKGKGKCAACHVVSGPGSLFTDFTFDNLGIPQNPANPAGVAPAFVDQGLGGFLATRSDYQQYAAANLGKHKVPTLRNVDLRPSSNFVKAYGHNGYFKSLEGIVHFYNTRDVKYRCPNPLTSEKDALMQSCWPAPEVAANVNTRELGNLHLTYIQEAAIVAFLKTLSDGFNPDAYVYDAAADPEILHELVHLPMVSRK
jgi:cytochrome c peroxidase